MQDPITQLSQRTQRYWYVDGISELFTGVFFWLLAAYFALQPVIPAGLPNYAYLTVGQPLLVIVGIFAGSRLVKAIKERVTYPRTGYVAYPKQAKERRGNRYVLLMVVAALTAGLVVLLQNWLPLRWMPALSSLFMGAGVAVMAYRIGLTRFYWLAIYTVLAGFTTASLGLAEPWDMALLFGLGGLGVFVSGLVTLLVYLRSTQPPSEDAHESA